MKLAFVLGILAVVGIGCEARVVAEREPREPREECKTVEVRNPHEREACVTRCGDEGCRTHCRENERVAREKKCWVD
jgi:hypothetical protein